MRIHPQYPSRFYHLQSIRVELFSSTEGKAR